MSSDLPPNSLRARGLTMTGPPAPVRPPSLHRLWATFDDPSIERAFQRENFDVAVRTFVRVSVTASVVAFLAYGLHDALVIPELRTAAWAIRYGFFAPLGLLSVLFVMKNRSPILHQAAMLGFGMAVNVAVLWIGAISSPSAGYFIYSSYAVVFVTLGPFIARMTVKNQIAYTLLSVAAFLAFDGLVAHAAPMIRLSLVVALFTLGTIGTIAAHQSEVLARQAFLQRRLIQEQMRELELERSRSDALLLNVLPKRIADRLKARPGETIADRFETVTVLFSDIVGFTVLSSRLPPDELVRRLDEVFSRFDAIADELGLEKIKTIGDAYMVAGGVPSRRDDHAAAVCEMAIRMRDSLAEIAAVLGAPLEVRIGIHTGPVVAGVIGQKKFAYDVWGDTVNVASRMESHGLPGTIQVSEATFAATAREFDYEERGEIQVKGKGAMKTYFLRRRIPLGNEATARAAAVDTSPAS